MAIFKVPVVWSMYGYLEIEADSEEEALDIAEMNQDDYPLPDDGDYLEGSFEIEHNPDNVIKLKYNSDNVIKL